MLKILSTIKVARVENEDPTVTVRDIVKRLAKYGFIRDGEVLMFSVDDAITIYRCKEVGGNGKG
jgi:nitrogen regulatory protein PII